MSQWLADQGQRETLMADERNGLIPTQLFDRRLRMMLGKRPLFDRLVNASFHGRRPLTSEGRGGETD